MGAAEMSNGYGKVCSDNLSGSSSASGPFPIAVVTGLLDTALRMWDDDCIRAKLQVKVATAMLHDQVEPSIAIRNGIQALPNAGRLAPWQTRTVKTFIDSSLGSTIRLRDCASKARLSASHFSRAFKATFGTTACDYIRQRRIEHSKQLMLLSGEPLSQIALACGFANQAHYCRAFRDVVGLSPNAWRREHINLAQDE